MKPLPMRQPSVEEVFRVLRDCFVEITHDFDSRVSLDSPVSILFDLHFSGLLNDGLDVVELRMELEERLGLPECVEESFYQRFDSGTVRDLCGFICMCIRPPEIRPITILGTSCESAGAFRAVQDVLATAGVKIDKLKPSTPIEPLLWKHTAVFTGPLSRLAPGRVPPVIWRNPLANVLLWLGMLSIPLALILPVFVGGPAKAVVMASLFGLCAVSWFVAGFLQAFPRFWSVSFGGLHDFRDLVNVILDRPQRIVGERGA